jgi:hypothetical protein
MMALTSMATSASSSTRRTSIQVSLEFPLIEVWEGSRLVGQVPQRDHVDTLTKHAQTTEK